MKQMVDTKPIAGKSYKHVQSPSEFMPKLPARIIVSGPSGGGKGVLCLNLLLNPKLYRGCCSAIYYASGSSTLDNQLKPLQEYCEKQLGMKKGECMIDGWKEDKIKRRHLKATEEGARGQEERGHQYRWHMHRLR